MVAMLSDPFEALRKLQYVAFGLAETTVQLFANGKTALAAFVVIDPLRTQAEFDWLTHKKIVLLFP